MEKHVLTVLVDEPNNQVEISVEGNINFIAAAIQVVRFKEEANDKPGSDFDIDKDETLIIADESGNVKEVFGKPITD